MYEERTAAPQRAFVLRPLLPWRAVTGESVPPSACPLYLGRVAEASDVFGALPHFRRGTIEAWLGEPPAPPLLDLLEAFEAGQNDWTHDPNRPKGGA